MGDPDQQPDDRACCFGDERHRALSDSHDHVFDAEFRAAAVGAAIAGDREFMAVKLKEELDRSLAVGCLKRSNGGRHGGIHQPRDRPFKTANPARGRACSFQ